MSALACNMANPITLWDGTVGPPPPEPLIKISLAERRAGCVSDLLTINELIEPLWRGSDPTAIDNLIFADAETRKVVAATSDDERSTLAQHMRDHGMRIDPQLLDPERWQCLIDIFRHRANLPTWLTRYCKASLAMSRGENRDQANRRTHAKLSTRDGAEAPSLTQ